MKNELQLLWKKRSTLFWKDAIRYLRVILTGYMYIPIILLILLAYLYHYILTQWTGSAWIGWIFAFLLSIPISGSRIRTFLYAPDSIRLLPLEDAMIGSYFRLSWLYSFIMQLFWLFLLMLLLSPLYYGMISEDRVDFYLAYVMVAGLSWMNLYAGFQEQRLRGNGIRFVHGSVRWVLNFLFLAGLFHAFSASVVVWLLVVGIGSVYYIRLSRHKDLFWTYLIEVEQRQLMRFYRFVGVFMDVPHLPVRVKRRKWLIYVMEKASIFTPSPYNFLFLRSLVRYQDIFSLYYRLLILAVLSLYFVEHEGLSIALFFLFLYLNGVQLAGSWKRVQAYFWDVVYPLSFREKIGGFSRTIFTFLFFQVWIETVMLVFKWGWWTALVVFVTGMLAVYLYAYPVLQKKLNEAEQ